MRRHRDGLPVGSQIASVPEKEPEMWGIARRMWRELGPQRVSQNGPDKLYGSFGHI